MTTILERVPPAPPPLSPEEVRASRQGAPTTLERVPPLLPLSPEQSRALRKREPSPPPKKAKRAWPFRHLVLVGLGILAVIAAAIAVPLATSSVVPSKPVVAVGQPLVITGNGLQAKVTVLSVTQSVHPYLTAVSIPPENGTYAVVTASISVKAGSYRWDPLYFTYQAANGRTYKAFDGNAWWAAYSPANVLSAGQSIRVQITFDVPAVGRDIQLTYPLGTVVGQWNWAGSDTYGGGGSPGPVLP